VNPWNLQRLPAEVGAVDQEQDPSRVRVIDQPVADVGGGECLARPNKEALPRKVANIPASDSVSGPQDRMNVATTRVASSVLQTQVAELQGFSMGGTGLEPVTQLVDSGQPFASVRGRSLGWHG
jgi:hypothetical protein